MTRAEPALSAPGSLQADVVPSSGSCLFHVILQLGIIDRGGSGAQVLPSSLLPQGPHRSLTLLKMPCLVQTMPSSCCIC